MSVWSTVWLKPCKNQTDFGKCHEKRIHTCLYTHETTIECTVRPHPSIISAPNVTRIKPVEHPQVKYQVYETTCRQLINTPFLNLAPAHTIVNISSYIQPKNIPSLHHWLMIHPSTSGQPEVRIWSTWTSLPTWQCGIFCLHRDHPEQNKHAPWKGGEEIGSQNQRGKRATSWFRILELSWQFF